jgi:integrase
VLEGHELREGIDLADTSRFGEDVWDLGPINHQDHLLRSILNFPTLPARFRAVSKELFYALLVGELPPGEIRLKQFSVRTVFTCVKRFLDWADTRGHDTLASMTQQDFLAYQQWLLSTHLGPSQRGIHRRSARLFWVFGDGLHTDRLSLDPQRLESWQTDTCKAPLRLENTTDRIPEEVISPLLVWALRWVNDFSEDILAARDEWWPLYINPDITKRPRRTGYGKPVRMAELQRLLDDYRKARRPLPATQDGNVNRYFLARQLQRDSNFLGKPNAQAMLAAAVAELGLADGSYLLTPMLARLDGTPWLAAVGYRQVPKLSRLLQSACYIVIAYLSGMRDSEVKHLRRGCISWERDRDGNVCRRTITSLAFKGEAPRGVSATWVVSESVERAVGILEQLRPDDAKYLFTILPGGSRTPGPNHAMQTQTTNVGLNEFVDFVNDYCATHHRADAIPLVRRQRWTLRTGQFRRTLAWFIARQPGGAIAGSIQYRHHSIQMFEGYAGTSESGFRGEVEAERTLQRREQLFAMIENHEHHDLRGPAAGEAQTRLDTLQRRPAYAGGVVTDRRRLLRIMRRDDPRIYLGHFVTCVYNPDKALCRRQLSADGTQSTPDLGSCQPLDCRNVALTAANRRALTDQLHKLDAHLAGADLLAPYVADRLAAQRRDLAEFLETATRNEDNP